MPLVRVSMHKGKPQEYINLLSHSIYKALVDSYQMPECDLFQVFEQLEPGSLFFDRHFGGGPRTDDFLLISIKSDARRVGEKEALMKSLVENLAESPGVKPEDVFIALDVNSNLEDYSFGKGISAAKAILA